MPASDGKHQAVTGIEQGRIQVGNPSLVAGLAVTLEFI